MRIPVDTLFEKHELLSFDKTQPESWKWVEFPYQDDFTQVQVPRFGEVLSVNYVLSEGEYLVFIGELSEEHFGEQLGCMILVRRLQGMTYRAVAFHTLFPLTRLGL